MGDLIPVSASERGRIQARLVKLERSEDAVAAASEKFSTKHKDGSARVGRQLLLREPFVYRSGDFIVPDTVPDRRQLPKRERPPASRLISPNGLALRAYLTAAFVAQSRTPGERPGNKFPLCSPEKDKVLSWVDLFATPAETLNSGSLYMSARDKSRRQLQYALKRLANPEIQLAVLPNAVNRSRTYEGFQLLHEQGAPYGGGINEERYSIPVQGKSPRLIRLPAGFFLNGWIHLLDDTEIVFLLMLAWLHARYGNQQVFISSKDRLTRFGLSKDAYESHRFLSAFGLVDVEEDERRHIEGGRVRDFSDNPTPRLHRFRLIEEGFSGDAVTTIRQALTEWGKFVVST
jgi:hypothetical protein